MTILTTWAACFLGVSCFDWCRIAALPPLPLIPGIYSGFGPLLTGLIGTRSGRKRLFWMGAQPVTNSR